MQQFAQKLRQFSGLNHLAQASRSVLSNPIHVLQMQQDYDKVDIGAISAQLQWACPDCDPAVLMRHEATFRDFHQRAHTLEQWSDWLQGIVSDVLGDFDSDEGYAARSHKLLLRWSLVSSLVIRDLTLRSVESFGPFHLMRLLCDEYVYFLVELAVANRGCAPVRHLTEPTTEEAPPVVGEKRALETESSPSAAPAAKRR